MSAIAHVPERVGGIDFSRLFIPEHLTSLFHTASYEMLTPPQRLRYNQLYAAYFHEQIIFFERALAKRVLAPFLGDSIGEELKAGLRRFMAEEERHSAMFGTLNRRCAPAYYRESDFHFIRISPVASRLLDWMAFRPKMFPLFVWLMLLQEERAVWFSRQFLKAADELEPHFVAVHRAHVADEIGHVRWDEELLDVVWPRTSAPLRRFNARLLGWMIGEFFSTPKRAGLRLVNALADEHPELRGALPEMRRQLLALSGDSAYRASLYSRNIVPETFARFECWPEFRALATALAGSPGDAT